MINPISAVGPKLPDTTGVLEPPRILMLLLMQLQQTFLAQVQTAEHQKQLAQPDYLRLPHLPDVAQAWMQLCRQLLSMRQKNLL